LDIESPERLTSRQIESEKGSVRGVMPKGGLLRLKGNDMLRHCERSEAVLILLFIIFLNMTRQESDWLN
jgi:hypothetical protein